MCNRNLWFHLKFTLQLWWLALNRTRILSLRVNVWFWFALRLVEIYSVQSRSPWELREEQLIVRLMNKFMWPYLPLYWKRGVPGYKAPMHVWSLLLLACTMDFGSVKSQYRLTDEENIAKILNSIQWISRSSLYHTNAHMGIPWKTQTHDRASRSMQCMAWQYKRLWANSGYFVSYKINVTGVFISLLDLKILQDKHYSNLHMVKRNNFCFYEEQLLAPKVRQPYGTLSVRVP